MAPEGLEKGLKAATDKAPKHGVLDPNLADSRRRPDLLDWRRALASLLVVLLIVAVVGAIARWRIGGATGDVYGATTELSQLGALVAFAAHV